MSFDLSLNISQNLQLQPLVSNMDVVFDSHGNLMTVSDQNKLIQEVQKIFATTVDNYYPSYQTKLDSIIGTNLGLEVTKNALAAMLLNSLAYVQYLKFEQAKYQQVSGSELLENVLSVLIDYVPEIDPNAGDTQLQTQFNCNVNIQNGLNNVINVSSALNLL